MRIVILALSFAFLGHAMATAAPAPPPMTPSGPWTVEFADSMCLLSRAYGKDRAINLAFKPGLVGNELEIIVLKSTSAIADPNGGKAILAVPGIATIGDGGFWAYSTPKARLVRIDADDKLPMAALRGSLSIDADDEGRYAFALPGIERALPVLTRCLGQLRAAYKISDAVMAAIATPPKADVLRLFSTNDYPREAARLEQSGTVGVLSWVETSGRVSSCEVIESSGAAALDQATCSIIQRRARFTPATDAAGKAIRAPTFHRIRWELPGF